MKLIDKDALVAEIESKIEKYTKHGEESDAKRDGYGMYWGGVISCLNEVQTLIDTLEVKEVNLEKEIQVFSKMELELIKIYDANVGLTITMHQLCQCAKHFFELGLNTHK